MINQTFNSRRLRKALSLSTLTTLCAALHMSTCTNLAVAAVQKPEDKSTKAELNKRSEQKTSDKRKEIVSEAVSTLRETQDALKLLDDGKTKEALAAVERATGKLEILLARDPKVSLVPIDVRVMTSDIYGSIDAIKIAKKEAEKALREGRVQEARSLLMGLTSETVISTTNIPLATYPAALKKAAKLIDENKAGEARKILQTALDTLVVTDMVVPLPVVSATINLEKAEELAKKKSRSEQENKELTKRVTDADTEIKYAQELGYGQKADFDSFHKQIEEIKAKTAGGKSGTNLFDQIKTYIESMTKSSQHKGNSSK
ncbi:MAG: YfdX family protein [Candidatus Obscuribacter sp.]|nr:YfdX family protein [Candidatus Obscuribacter sp.]